jgi:DNA excision repair protein ERCC-4
MTRSRMPAELRPEKVVCVVDTREQNPVDMGKLPFERDTLRTGDYAIKALPNVCAIERKSESDLLSCIGTERERFDAEVVRLLAYPVRALVVESTWQRIEAGEWRSKITPQAALGSLIGWIAMGLPVLMAGDHERAGVFIQRILFTAARRRWREARGLFTAVEELRCQTT